MSKETEAEERGEDIAPVVDDTPGNGSTDLGSAQQVSGSELIADDSDAPVADNKISPDPLPEHQTEAPSGDAPNVNPPPSTGKKRGRKPMTPEEKAQAKAMREAFKAGKPPPDFSSLNKGSTGAQGGQIKPPRDYYLEACSLFIPVSAVGSKLLGPHWAVPIVDKEVNGIMQKAMEPTEEQKQYLTQMARWLEYEQFPEINPRWGFVIATVGYGVPKLKQDPTPERLGKAWEWIRVKILRREPKAQK